MSGSENRPTSRLGATLWLASTMLLVVCATRLLLPLAYPGEFSELSLVYRMEAWFAGLRFDVVTLARVAWLPLLLMNLPGAWFERRAWFETVAWLAYVVTLAMALVLAGDLVYFPQVHRHLAHETAWLLDEVPFLLREVAARWYLLLIFAMFAGVLFRHWQRVLRRPRQRLSREALAFLAVVTALFVGVRGAAAERPLEIIDAFPTGDSAYGQIVLNGVFTGMEFAWEGERVNHHFFDLRDALREVKGARPAEEPRFPLLRHVGGRPTGYNIVFVLLESWDFQHVDSFAGNGYGATPEFDALARDGRRFMRFYATGQRSNDGVWGTLTGMPPVRGLPTFQSGLGIFSFTRLGTIAQRHGYDTLFVQSSHRESLKVDQVAKSCGFAATYGMEDIPLRLAYPDRDASYFGWDYDTLMFAKDRMDESRRPFLAYIFTGTTHTPYAPLPAPFAGSYSSAGEDGYLATLRYADWSIGEFMRAARKEPWFNRTIFIFTGDHTGPHVKGNYAEHFHTPMLIYAPGIIAPGIEKERVGSQLDVLPTILDALGFDDPYAALGGSLLQSGVGGEAFTSTGGLTIGLVTPAGFVNHNLANRMEVGSFGGKRADYGAIERRLLSMDQVVFELTRENRWAP